MKYNPTDLELVIYLFSIFIKSCHRESNPGHQVREPTPYQMTYRGFVESETIFLIFIFKPFILTQNAARLRVDRAGGRSENTGGIFWVFYVLTFISDSSMGRTRCRVDRASGRSNKLGDIFWVFVSKLFNRTQNTRQGASAGA